MSITMNIHIQDGAVRVFGSDLELANASAVDKAAFDAIISAISSVTSATPIPSTTDRSKPIDDWDEEEYEEEGDEDEDLKEEDEEEKMKETLEEMFGTAFEAANLSELAKKLKEIFGQ